MSPKPFERKLNCEALESRRLLASDLHFGHNFRFPEDTDSSGTITPMDALRVINALNLNGVSASSRSAASLVDVNADGNLTPLDALTVINRLNGEGEGGPSGVAVAARIARIEAALSSHSLPANMSVEEATQILETLTLGGSPELGDCSRVIEATIEEKLEGLSDRLSELGVTQEKVDTVVASIQSAIEAGETEFREIVDHVLEENEIDLSALREAYHEQQKIERIVDHLTSAEVDATIIEQVKTELIDAVEAGTSMSKEELKTLLTELGVDLITLFPAEVVRPRHGGEAVVIADQVEQRLEAMGADASSIATIIAEIEAAEAAGTPMTRSELFARLQELGVTLAKPTPAIGARLADIGARISDIGAKISQILRRR